MSDPQPSAAAKRLVKALADEGLFQGPFSSGYRTTEQIEDVAAIALDDAGVAEAVDKLERISLSMACSDLKSWSHLIDEALAALTGNDNAK